MVTHRECGYIPFFIVLIITALCLDPLQVVGVDNVAQDGLIQIDLLLEVLDRLKQVGLFPGMLFIQVLYLSDCLLVPNPIVLYQIPHLMGLFLQILVVRLHQKHFFFLLQLFVN